jgi:hypothetical protein
MLEGMEEKLALREDGEEGVQMTLELSEDE